MLLFLLLCVFFGARYGGGGETLPSAQFHLKCSIRTCFDLNRVLLKPCLELTFTVTRLEHIFIVTESRLEHIFTVTESRLEHIFIVTESCLEHIFIVTESRLEHIFIVTESRLEHIFIVTESLQKGPTVV